MKILIMGILIRYNSRQLDKYELYLFWFDIFDFRRVWALNILQKYLICLCLRIQSTYWMTIYRGFNVDALTKRVKWFNSNATRLTKHAHRFGPNLTRPSLDKHKPAKFMRSYLQFNLILIYNFVFIPKRSTNVFPANSSLFWTKGLILHPV